MIYQQCGQPCPQTCDTNEHEECVGRCIEGCFCPSGKVLWNGNCINSSECAGEYMRRLKIMIVCHLTFASPNSMFVRGIV